MAVLLMSHVELSAQRRVALTQETCTGLHQALSNMLSTVCKSYCARGHHDTCVMLARMHVALTVQHDAGGSKALMPQLHARSTV